jgi:hypothetical protein
MFYRVKSSQWDEVWEGSLEELFETNQELDSNLREQFQAMQPGEQVSCVVYGVSYVISCHAEDARAELGQPESMARAIETLLETLRQRGVTPEVDLSGFDEYRKLHPRQDA